MAFEQLQLNIQKSFWREKYKLSNNSKIIEIALDCGQDLARCQINPFPQLCELIWKNFSSDFLGRFGEGQCQRGVMFCLRTLGDNVKDQENKKHLKSEMSFPIVAVFLLFWKQCVGR